MDERTRFRLFSVISETRSKENVTSAFQESKKVAGKKPMAMVTDRLPSYKQAFNKEFYDHHQS